MKTEARLNTLAERHRATDETLGLALSSPSVSDAEIAEIKKRKLRLKDEMRTLGSASTLH